MPKGWIILASILGILTATFVWIWPRGPICRFTDEGDPRSFSADSLVLVTIDQVAVNKPTTRQLNPVVRCWNTRTGSLLRKTELPCSDRDHGVYVLASADGTRALVGEKEGKTNTASWYLHETQSGQRLTSALAGVDGMPLRPFSPNGEWFIGLGDPLPEDWFSRVSVHSALNGELIASSPSLAGRFVHPFGFCYAPDNNSVAVEWQKTDDDLPGIVQIIELPSGRELRQFVMPGSWRFNVKRWDGRRLLVQEYQRDPKTNHDSFQGWILDASSAKSVEATQDPLLRSSRPSAQGFGWRELPGRIAYLTRHEESDLERTINKCKGRLSERRLGMRLPEPPMTDVTILERRDARNRFVATLPSSKDILFSEDGKLIANSRYDEVIEVWDTDPSSRLPAVILAGLASSGCVLAFGHWRGIRRKSASECGCTVSRASSKERQ